MKQRKAWSSSRRRRFANTAEPFVSGIRQNLAGRTGALEDLAVELYARGLSTRDIEERVHGRSRTSAARAGRP